MGGQFKFHSLWPRVYVCVCVFECIRVCLFICLFVQLDSFFDHKDPVLLCFVTVYLWFFTCDDVVVAAILFFSIVQFYFFCIPVHINEL